jgi:hypothetical protein
VRPEGLGKLEKIHFIGRRSRDLSVCSTVPQPPRYRVLYKDRVREKVKSLRSKSANTAVKKMSRKKQKINNVVTRERVGNVKNRMKY